MEQDMVTYSIYKLYVNHSADNPVAPSSKPFNNAFSDVFTNVQGQKTSAEFASIGVIQNEMDVEVLVESQVENITSMISYDKNNNVYFYLETNGNQKNLLFYVNNTKYILEEDEENIYLLASEGQKLPVVETSFLEEQNPFDISLNREQIKKGASWILIGSNLKKTSTSWVIILEAIALAANTYNTKVNHRILGTILLIWSYVSQIGQSVLVTLYVLYSQYYRSDCMTYIKEVDNYYQYNNYTGFVKSNTWYFHTERPESEASGCNAYY